MNSLLRDAWSAEDAAHMARALRLARSGLGQTHPNPAVGCVIVRDGEVVGEGFHARAGTPHAEVHALRAAGEAARGAEVFVTLEPCAHTGRTPPCADALIDAGVARVVVASTDPDPRTAGQGMLRLQEAGIVVERGLMADAADALNRGYMSRLTRGRPYTTLKLAASLDGRTAMASGESRWITSAEARADVHRQRALHHAVLTSAQTVLDDDPRLTVRLPDAAGREAAAGDAAVAALEGGVGGVAGGASPGSQTAEAVPRRQPDRIVLDGRGRSPVDARVWQDDGAQRWLLTPGHADAEALQARGVRVERVARRAEGLDLAEALHRLGACDINDVLVECGPRLAGALLQADLIDEILLYLAPSLLGDAARPLAVLPGLERLDQRLDLRWQEIRQIGSDIRLRAAPAGSADGA